jgi:tetratricopeptide (TPR) repeat protein
MTMTRWWRSGIVVALMLVLGAVGPSEVLADGAPDKVDRPGADPDYTAGVNAIKAEKFAAAIPLLEKVVARDGRNADAHNWLAYAVRRNGDPARSIPIYEKALALDPQHRGAHEYIGEAYLMLGNLPKAKEHLARLNSLCFLPCSEYTDLKKAVEQHEKGGKTSTTR